MRSELREWTSTEPRSGARIRLSAATRAGHPTVPDQLPDPVSRAGVDPLAGKHRHLPDILHKHRADGVLSGRVGRLSGSRAKILMDERCLFRWPSARRLPLGFPLDLRARPAGMIDVGSQQSPQVIYFGAELRLKDFSKWVIPIELLAGYFFALIALLFAALGQEMGRRFAAIENRLLSYSVDILGSLAGIVAFAAMSYFRLPAYFWFAIALALGSYFVPRRRWLHACGAPVLLAFVFWADWPRDAYGVATDVVWSPYYQVRFKQRFQVDRRQQYRPPGHGARRPTRVGYFLPHLLNRDAGASRLKMF